MRSSTHRPDTSRARAAAANRRRVVAAAEELFLARGWSGTTIRDVATRAGVSPETVYKGFGGKAALLKAVYDLRIAGDDQPLTIAEREGIARLVAARTTREAADAWAAHALGILQASADLMRLALGAQAHEPELAEFVRTTDDERRAGAARTAGHWDGAGWLRVPPEESADRLWLLGAPSSHLARAELGWDADRHRAWLRECVLALVLDPEVDGVTPV